MGTIKEKNKDFRKNRVYVSKEEWLKLSDEAKLELIALSRMTGEDVQNNLEEDELKIYNKLMGFEE